ncbi:polymorphic toxin-type HINT domain-containing protein [Paenibacillus radicibacter]|uniref:polymorphic toxin-type HINT domain-containing protein n=1 Tax=Paenibacillus radicibacter TaxID=2972488 RepID=UPI002159A096|nr:polymorphic toxin-type HINT domain-containing protein [Paenibacillus radicibacter]
MTYPDNNFIEKVYDQSGNLLIEKDENKSQTLHAYDKEGNEKTLTDRKGNTFTYEYDTRNRLKKKTATNREIGTYDPEITFDYDLAGRMTTMNDYTGTTKYQYDYTAGGAKLGLLQSISYPDGKQLSYEYDIAGQVTRMTDPFGKVTNSAYQAGRLDKVGQDLTKPDASYTYKAGNLDRIDLNTGKIVTNQTYTEGMLSDVTHKTGAGQALGSYGYEYDDYANITKLKENSQVTSSLTYDPLHRVQTNSMFKETYQYNSRSNRETLQSDQLPQISQNQYKYDSRDQLLEVKSPAKNNGKAKQVSYVYNGQGLMIKRTEENQVDAGDRKVSRYYYDADANIIAEEKTEGEKTSQYSYIRSGSQLVAKVDQAGSKQYYLHNGRGDVVSITDDQGKKIAEYKYDIWGKILPTAGNNLANKVDNVFLYSGEYYDETTELQYLRARWYDPSVGRFIQEDAYNGELSDPLSQNLYTYAHNNPLRYDDPSGHAIYDMDADGSNNSWYNDDYRTTWTEAGKILYGMGASIVTDTIRPWTDPNAGLLDKAHAVADLTPLDRMLKFGKLIFKIGSNKNKIKKTTKTTENAVQTKKNSSCNCFTAGTKVVTDDGEENIEDIEVGDKVLAKNEYDSNGELAYKEVTALYRNQRDDIIKLYVGEQIIETTDNHPFWVEGKGWVFADELLVGDKLQKSDGSNLTIDKVEFVKLDEPVTVYNFTVADYHTYYVTGIGIWVHNTQCMDSASAAKTINNADRSSTALSKSDPGHRAASFLTEAQIGKGTTFNITGGDGIQRTLLQVNGGLDGKNGIYEYIIDSNATVSHQRFIEGGIINGVPNQRVKK